MEPRTPARRVRCPTGLIDGGEFRRLWRGGGVGGGVCRVGMSTGGQAGTQGTPDGLLLPRSGPPSVQMVMQICRRVIGPNKTTTDRTTKRGQIRPRRENRVKIEGREENVAILRPDFRGSQSCEPTEDLISENITKYESQERQ